jgi:hypothetical protein
MRALILSGILACFSYAAPVPKHREPPPISASKLVGTWEIKREFQHWIYTFHKDGGCTCKSGGNSDMRWSGVWRWHGGKIETKEYSNRDVPYIDSDGFIVTPKPTEYSVKLLRGKTKGTFEGSENQWVSGTWRRVQ